MTQISPAALQIQVIGIQEGTDLELPNETKTSERDKIRTYLMKCIFFSVS